MIADLKPYPAMKTPGVPWLGEVPAHWEVSHGRTAFREKKVKNSGMIESQVLSLSYGRIVVKPPEKLHGLVPESFETYQVVEPNDIIVRSTDLQNDWNSLRIGLVRDRGIITSAYLCLNVKGTLIPEYAHLILHAYDLKKVYYGMGSGLRQNLDITDFKYLPILVPPSPEQYAIVRFLDHANRKIQHYIYAKQKLINLLGEQKQAIIHRAVTHGLDTNVRLKSSGLEWLGEIPEHWVVKRLRFILQRNGYKAGPFGSALITSQLLPQGDILVLSPEHIANGKTDLAGNLYLPPSRLGEMSQFLVQPRDVVFPIVGTLGRAMVISTGMGKAILNQRLARLRPNETEIVSEYLTLLLSQVRIYQELDRVESKGSILEHITKERILGRFLPLPPPDEQRNLLHSIAGQVSDVERTINLTLRKIDLLREYRTRLITDVVMGKLDVREVAATLHEEPHDFESINHDEADVIDEFEDESADGLEDKLEEGMYAD